MFYESYKRASWYHPFMNSLGEKVSYCKLSWGPLLHIVSFVLHIAFVIKSFQISKYGHDEMFLPLFPYTFGTSFNYTIKLWITICKYLGQDLRKIIIFFPENWLSGCHNMSHVNNLYKGHLSNSCQLCCANLLPVH